MVRILEFYSILQIHLLKLDVSLINIRPYLIKYSTYALCPEESFIGNEMSP